MIPILVTPSSALAAREVVSQIRLLQITPVIHFVLVTDTDTYLMF